MVSQRFPLVYHRSQRFPIACPFVACDFPSVSHGFPLVPQRLIHGLPSGLLCFPIVSAPCPWLCMRCSCFPFGARLVAHRFVVSCAIPVSMHWFPIGLLRFPTDFPFVSHWFPMCLVVPRSGCLPGALPWPPGDLLGLPSDCREGARNVLD